MRRCLICLTSHFTITRTARKHQLGGPPTVHLYCSDTGTRAGGRRPGMHAACQVPRPLRLRQEEGGAVLPGARVRAVPEPDEDRALRPPQPQQPRGRTEVGGDRVHTSGRMLCLPAL